MCNHLIVHSNGTGQCKLALTQDCPPQVKSAIRKAFQDAATEKYPDPKPQLGIAGGPPNCMFYYNPHLEWADCPYYEK